MMTIEEFVWYIPFQRYTVRQVIKFFQERTRLEVNDIPKLKTTAGVKRYLLLNWPTATSATWKAFACYCARQALPEFKKACPANSLLEQALNAMTAETVDERSLRDYVGPVGDLIIELVVSGEGDAACAARAVEGALTVALDKGTGNAPETAEYVAVFTIWALRKCNTKFRRAAEAAQIEELVRLLTSEGSKE